MTKDRYLSEGVRVRVRDVEGFDGLTGEVAEVHKSRGEPTVYNVSSPGQPRPLSFFAHELDLIDQPARRARKGAA